MICQQTARSGRATLSRRSILYLVSGFPLPSALPVGDPPVDVELLRLGDQFNSLAAQIDYAIEHKSNLAWDVLHQFDSVESEILVTPAGTIEGLSVKARAACWALLGDLDAAGQSTTDKRMALSIVRDLIRLYDPNLERPAASTKLACADNSATHETTGRVV
jgi:hypothetical protein